jgi:hypothetical protein
MSILLALVAATPAAAQDRSGAQDQDETAQQGEFTPLAPGFAGGVANSAVGEAGQRQTRAQAAPNIQPMARIDSRIDNRINNRLQTRIDRSYDPHAIAVTPFEVAEERAQNPGPESR